MENPGTFNPARWLIPVLCLLAGIRVFVFSAAFPFFTNMDEAAQFDVVVKYSHLEIPRPGAVLSAESSRYLAIFGTPEYSSKEGAVPPPLWTLPLPTVAGKVRNLENWWRQHLNYEAMEPPLYYFLAGQWLHLGRIGGLVGEPMLYWIRFLNIGLAATLVWLGFVAVRIAFPDRLFLQIGVAFLLALWPQDAFYSMQSDALSPICFGLAIIALLRLASDATSRPWFAVLAGLSLAATFLTKVNNLGLVAVAFAAVLLRAWQWRQQGRRRSHLPAISIFFLTALLPIAAWLARNYYLAGDLTASAAKIHFLGWTLKPVAAWWPHPIFTAAGAWTFCSDLLASFWRGELIWHDQRLSNRAIDLFYALATALFVGSALVGLLRRQIGTTDFQRQTLTLAVLWFAVSVLTLALLSIMFDFGRCLYPSRSYPFFASGRLMSGAAIPIMLLYVYGLETFLRSCRIGWIRYPVLGAIGLLITGSEVFLSLPVFSSQYNFFHL